MNKRKDLSKIAEDHFVVIDKSKLEQWSRAEHDSLPMLSPADKGSLLPVRIELIGKGTLDSNALICVPGKGDLGDSTSIEGGDPVEPVNKDENESARKTLKEKHSKMKIRQRRKWKKMKDELEELRSQSVVNKTPLDEEKFQALSKEFETLKAQRETENEAFVKEMNQLWLRQSAEIKESCSKTVMGWVVRGGFSYRVGKNVGLGFVPTLAYSEFLSAEEVSLEKKRVVLVRETNSAQYRKAKISIICHK